MSLSPSPVFPLVSLCLASVLGLASTPAVAQANSLDDIHFTGPLITPNAAGLPHGAWNVEPYLVRVDSDHYYDADGNRTRSNGSSGAWLTVVPIAHGISDRVTAQVNLSAVRAESGASRSGGFRAGDTTARLQFLLQAPDADGARPAVAVALTQRFATGSYDRVGGNPLNAQGDGVQRTSAAVAVQQVLWLPNGRPLRWRGQFSASPAPSRVALHDSSVYGTGPDFRGSVARGSLLGLSMAAEYSISARWVGVFEVSASRESDQQLSGYVPGDDGVARRIEERRPASSSISLAPAVEYHFAPNVGLIAGVEFSVGGRNSGAFISPQIALAMSF